MQTRQLVGLSSLVRETLYLRYAGVWTVHEPASLAGVQRDVRGNHVERI